MNEGNGIRIAQSCARDAREAVREFHAGAAQPDMSLVVFFCSNEFDRDELAAEMRRLFADVDVVGCTTAGEIGPTGCRDRTVSGVSFSHDACVAVTGRLGNLRQFRIADGHAIARDMLLRLDAAVSGTNAQNGFALLLVDGSSVREELVAHALQGAFGDVPVIGGSAGDGLDFGSTYVFADGRFHADSAVLIAARTPLQVTTFKTQHFEPTTEMLVVTEADPARRVVKEINGLPATEEYARILGVRADQLDPPHFAASPVVVLIDGANYVRSIQKAEADGSLTFFCAIEEGLVLRVATGMDLLSNLEETFAGIREEVGPPLLTLTFDCILRKLEIVENDLVEPVSEVYRRNNAVGFNTYGEQARGVHVNQTLTGIALGLGGGHDR